MPDHQSLPAVTCLCPTYGRFQLLRRAVACFLAQDYPNKRLLICNDASTEIRKAQSHRVTVDGETPCDCHGHLRPGDWGIANTEKPFANLGVKRQWLLEAADSPLVAHWDDDDLYLPWHLSRSVAALLEHDAGPDLRSPQGEVGCVKSRGAWYMVGDQIRGEIHHNVFEGSMLFRRDEALELGGYPPTHSGQAKALMKKFLDAGRLYKIPDHESFVGCTLSPVPCSLPSYVYCWAQPGAGHISAFGNKPAALQSFRAGNQDFGDGEPLTPADLTPAWLAVLAGAKKALSNDDYQAFEQSLKTSVPSVPLR